MKLIDLVILLVLTASFGFAIRSVIKTSKKGGCSSCGGSCSGCSSSCSHRHK